VRQRHLSLEPFRHSAVCIPPFGGLVALLSADRRNHNKDYSYKDYSQRLTIKQAHVGFADDVPVFLDLIGGWKLESNSQDEAICWPDPREATTIPPNGGKVRTPSEAGRT
jgi:hypothetical protein